MCREAITESTIFSLFPFSVVQRSLRWMQRWKNNRRKEEEEEEKENVCGIEVYYRKEHYYITLYTLF